jgi:hypothetical protein
MPTSRVTPAPKRMLEVAISKAYSLAIQEPHLKGIRGSSLRSQRER